MIRIARENTTQFFECDCGNRAFELRFLDHKVNMPSNGGGVLDLYCYGCNKTYSIAGIIAVVARWLIKRYGRGRCISAASKTT